MSAIESDQQRATTAKWSNCKALAQQTACLCIYDMNIQAHMYMYVYIFIYLHIYLQQQRKHIAADKRQTVRQYQRKTKQVQCEYCKQESLRSSTFLCSTLSQLLTHSLSQDVHTYICICCTNFHIILHSMRWLPASLIAQTYTYVCVYELQMFLTANSEVHSEIVVTTNNYLQSLFSSALLCQTSLCFS